MTFPPSYPSSGYIDLGLTTNPNVLAQQAFADIMAQLPGWTPSEGQLDVAIIEEAAFMAASSATVANQMAVQAFMYFGGLVGVTPLLGVAATATAEFTMTDSSGYTIPQGTQIAYPLSGNQQVIFLTETALTIPSGQTTGSVTVQCSAVGVFANGLTPNTCQMVTTFAQVASVATTTTSAGGVAADTATTYINRLATELQLMAPRPITISDYAAMAPNVEGVYRALAINGLNPGRTFADASVTSGGHVVTSPADALFTSADIGKTVTVTGSAVTGSAVITAVGTGSGTTTTATISGTFGTTKTGVSASLSDLTNQERCVTLCGVDSTGTGLSSTVNANLVAYFEALREVNFLVFAIEPTYATISVTVACDAVSGTNPTSVQAAIESALTSFLSPANWGGGDAQVPYWSTSSNVVRFLDVANVIRTVSGVLYIPSGSLTIGMNGGSMGTSDLTMPGDAPLPEVGTLSITVTAT